MNIFSRLEESLSNLDDFICNFDPEETVFKPIIIFVNWFDQIVDALFNFAESSPDLFVFIAIAFIVVFRVAIFCFSE